MGVGQARRARLVMATGIVPGIVWLVLFGGAAVLALGWAFRAGQFDNFDQGAKSIFGPDEPIGEPTDAFPGVSPAEMAGVGPQDAIDRALEDVLSSPFIAD